MPRPTDSRVNRDFPVVSQGFSVRGLGLALPAFPVACEKLPVFATNIIDNEMFRAQIWPI
jgi:hypothetical protein